MAVRRLGGQEVTGFDFVGYWAHRLIFFQAEPWVFTLIYVLFGAAVLLTFVLGPPRIPKRRTIESTPRGADGA